MTEESKQARYEFSIEWQSKAAKHIDRYYFDKINYWRDILPGELGESIQTLQPGEFTSEEFKEGVLVRSFDKYKTYKVPKSIKNLDKLAENNVSLKTGRFCPRGAFSSIGFDALDIRPLRIIENKPEHAIVDVNHPLSSFPIKVTATLLETLPMRSERGGNSNDIAYTMTDGGPGFQADLPDSDTDFFSDDPFEREENGNDQEFYGEPSLVDYIDKTASKHISDIYKRFLKPGMNVLDLMSSWNSHIEIEPDAISVSGLGLNQQELDENKVLTCKIIHDLNEDAALPINNSEFDAAVCTLSIEYLTAPIDVMKEVGRILKPGAPFVITFSDRWIPAKTIKIWKELHLFERMALVIEYFKQSGQFSDIHSESIRGFPRPGGDKHFLDRISSDPVFAVWGFAV